MAHAQTLGANDPFHYAVEQYLKQMYPQDNWIIIRINAVAHDFFHETGNAIDQWKLDLTSN